jgi:hypothetical protein
VPAPGGETIGAVPTGVAAIVARMRSEKDANGGQKYFTDAKFRAEMDAALTNAQGQAA